MDGYELARQIRQGEEGGTDHLPIIAITANAMKDAREDCAAAGMDDYLVKPREIQALQEALAEYLPKAVNREPVDKEEAARAHDSAFWCKPCRVAQSECYFARSQIKARGD